jgi:hypothetical protein
MDARVLVIGTMNLIINFRITTYTRLIVTHGKISDGRLDTRIRGGGATMNAN